MKPLDYDDFTTAYTNKILTEIATNSPRPLVKSVSVHRDLLKSRRPDHIQYKDNIYRNLVSRSNYRPYFVTTTFKHIPLSATGMKQQYRYFTEYTWTQYSKTYRHLMSNLTNHYDDKPNLQPITYDFFDVPGTRDSRYTQFTETTIPHIHSVYLVHKKEVSAFQYHIETKFHLITKHHSLIDYVQTIHAEPVDQDIHRVISYCSKFYDNHYAVKIRDEYPLFNQFPITDEQKQLLKNDRDELRYQEIANRIFKQSYSPLVDQDEMKNMRKELKKRFNRS
jgi:hypothetical protein